jgi:DNA repair protein RecO (recombination protein O)
LARRDGRAAEIAYRCRRRADTPMPLRESEAIVLRCYPLGEADRLVSFLSRSYGRLRGVARGARRPKSRFGSTLEPLSHIRVWFYERETRELVRVNQCELLESFLAAQSDYRRSLTLALMCEIAEAVLPEREASDPAFRLLLVAARAVRDGQGCWLPLLYYCLWTVRLGGWLPNLDVCSRCGRALGIGAAHGAVHRPALACEHCRRPGMRQLPGEELALARQMLEQKLEKVLASHADEQSGRKLGEFLLDLIEQQLERKLTSRKLLETA